MTGCAGAVELADRRGHRVAALGAALALERGQRFGLRAAHRAEPVQAGDDPAEIEHVGAVDLRQPLVPGALGVGDALLGALELLLEHRPVALIGEEMRAGVAGVGVRAALLDRQPALAVRERLLGPGELVLEPRGVVVDHRGGQRARARRRR